MHLCPTWIYLMQQIWNKFGCRRTGIFFLWGFYDICKKVKLVLATLCSWNYQQIRGASYTVTSVWKKNQNKKKRRSTAQYRAQSLQVGHGGAGMGGAAHLEQCILSSWLQMEGRRQEDESAVLKTPFPKTCIFFFFPLLFFLVSWTLTDLTEKCPASPLHLRTGTGTVR